MKKTLYAFSAVLMLFVSSCSKYDQPVLADDVKMVTATINAESTDGGTKTIAIYNSEDKKYEIKWTKGDKLSVFNSKNTDMSEFTSTITSDKAATSKFIGEIPEESQIVAAIYPYNAKASVSADKKTVYTNVPTEQTGDFNNVVLAGWPKDEGVNVNAEVYDFKYQFEAVCGIVKFSFDPDRIAGSKAITSISLTADNPLCGDAKISYPTEGKPALTPNPNATGSNVYNTITIEKKDGFTAGDYYFATFPINANGDEGLKIVIRFETSTGDVAYKQATLKAVGEEGSKHILAANIVKNIGTVKVEEYDEINGLFSVASDKTVYFSPGNLQYKASTNTWRFALNQWDAQGNLGNSTKPNSSTDEGARATQSDWIDLFRWGHSGCTIDNRTYLPYDCAALELPSTSMEGNTYKYLDWGVQNDIQNGDKTDPAGTWRLLTIDELNYMTGIGGPTKYRKSTNNPANATKITATFKNAYGTEVTKSADALFLRCKVNTGDALRYGMMIFPDQFTWPADIPVPYVANTSVTQLAFNYKTISEADAPVYTLTQFAEFEKQGVIFLPCAGYRNAFDPNKPDEFVVNDINVQAKYFTSSQFQHLSFDVTNFSFTNRLASPGWSVRLVKNGTGF